MSEWSSICHLDDIVINSGRCALLNGEQVAIFRINDVVAGEEKFYAVNNHCPFSAANVISRGIVGSVQDKTVVASPLYKQHFDLSTGQCLEDENVKLKTYNVRLTGEMIELAA